MLARVRRIFLPSYLLSKAQLSGQRCLTDNWTLSAAIFDRDAAGQALDDSQLRDNHGADFRINDPPPVIGEVQYIWNGKNTIRG